MTRDELLALAARVEGATGADEDLDRAVALATGWRQEMPHGTEPYGYLVPPNGIGWVIRAPAFTASIDAALTLVPEGWRFSVDNLSAAGPLALCEHWPKSGPAHMYQRGEAATPALALTAAALRARAEEVPGD